MGKSKKNKKVKMVDIESGTIVREEQSNLEPEPDMVVRKPKIEPKMIFVQFTTDEEVIIKNALDMLLNEKKSEFIQNLVLSVKDLDWKSGKIEFYRAQQIAVNIMLLKNSFITKENKVLNVTEAMANQNLKIVEGLALVSDKLLKFCNMKVCMVCKCELKQDNIKNIIIFEDGKKMQREICLVDFESADFNRHFKKCDFCETYLTSDSITEENSKNICKLCQLNREAKIYS